MRPCFLRQAKHTLLKFPPSLDLLSSPKRGYKRPFICISHRPILKSFGTSFMGTEETTGTLPFQLQFDKPVASQIKIAEWNPEKDLLAMVTEDSKILLHRFNWQRLWTIPSGRRITSLCWCPDGKAIAVGHEDGTISLHDVENGKLLRSIKSHNSPVVCLSWEEDVQQFEEGGNIFKYEDRTPRFFPSAPRVPRMPGLASGDAGLIDDNDDSFREPSGSSHQRFNILCSSDNEGCLCFSIFGIFPIGKINVNKFSIHTPSLYQQDTYRLLNASVYKVALSKDLCQLIIMCFGELIEEKVEPTDEKMPAHGLVGCHTLLLDISVFWKRKNELHQVAQQASNIEDLFEVIRASISIMSKQWSEAMRMFNDKFDPLATLIIDHGLDSSPQEEFLSLLGGARTSPALHQFLVNSLGESGLKRVAKTVQSAGKELPIIVRDHLQPAAEIVAFRIGELRGLSKWRARFQGIGLDEKLIDNVTEKAGMLLIQVERFLKVLSTMVYQFQNFFTWLTKCVKLLMSEPCDQLPPFNSELIVVFLKFLFGQDPVKQLLEHSELECSIEIDLDTIQRLKELAQFGGFSDTEFLRRTLAKEFELLEYSFKEAFQLPFTTISKNLRCEGLLPLFPLSFLPIASSLIVPTSISYYEDVSPASQCRLLDYILFRIPDESFSDVASSIGIVRGFMHDFSKVKKGNASLEAVLLCLPDGCHCVDLSLYKETQIVLLLNETTATSESPGSAQMIILEANDLPFVSISGSDFNHWKLHELKDSIVELQIETEKARSIPHSVVGPLAVSTSRGVACVFAARKRVLVYILEEDEDEVSEVD